MSYNRSILLVNPWIYDFAAYDFWSKPLGLLQIGAALKNAGFQVQLLDVLDRHHPILREHKVEQPPQKPDGSGKYHREIIPKPDILKDIPRQYSRYGLPMDLTRSLLESLTVKPDLILLTSIMTYWYPGVKAMRDLLKSVFPDTPIMLGGIYASLCAEHAIEYIKPDHVFTGRDMAGLLKLICEILTEHCSFKNNLGPFPNAAWDLYQELHTLTVMTSLGCPNRCSFCASHALTGSYCRYHPDDVYNHIAYWQQHTGFRHLAFYDDALLHRPGYSIKPILSRLADSDFALMLHTPNGLQPRYIDLEFAELFAAAGGHTVRLSFETINPERQRTMSTKITNTELINAVQCLKKAGLPGEQIGVYIMLGLPDQDMEEVVQSVRFVADLEVKVNLASFSPIPGTKEWERLLESNQWSEQDDLLLTNTSIFPLWTRQYGYDKVETFIKEIKNNYIHHRTGKSEITHQTH